MSRLFGALLVLFGLSVPALAEPVTHGTLVIDKLRTFGTPPNARAAAGYFSVTNGGDAVEALVGLTADFPRAEVHESFEDSGVMRMRHIERLEVPAGATIDLAPGGLHVMFMGLSGPFEVGGAIQATLIFEHAGEIAVEFPIFDPKMRGKLTDASHSD